MFTMVASSTTISWARAMKTSAFQRLACASFARDASVCDGFVCDGLACDALDDSDVPAVSDMGVPTSGLRDGKRIGERTGDGDGDGDGRELSWSGQAVR
ncbi:hypothetical protein [Streptomyces sp. 11x1]|uniref:hypothetical protein n=1 Tax=Streptomyces sp. 11x1 TaxID=3038642 RepID=UPI00292E2267|nr:hypothetical protein [Streptomyces sp. 11x1]WNZ14859.1 hypothetical protein P8T65_27010 [Streptomyces sp. 11x1]